MAQVHVASAQLDGQTGHQAGRALLARFYREITGQMLPPIRIAPRGKPYFESGPWHFSISHTPTHVFCALALCPVGLDAENQNRDINLKLADKILSPWERLQFDAADHPRQALLTFWVLKEAQSKLTGDGLRGYPNHTNFSLDDPRVTIRDGCVVAVLTEGD